MGAQPWELRKNRIKFKQYAIYIIFAVLCIVMAIVSPGFGTVVNFMNIIKQVAIVTIIAFGASMVLISGELDLSPGAVCALAGCVAANFGHPGTPVYIPILMAIVVGLTTGFINGFISAKGKVPSFIVTLGMSTSVRGLTLILTNGANVANLSDEYQAVGGSYLFGIPILAFILIGVFIIAFYIMEKTRFGRYVYAVGGNEKATYLSGINTSTIKIAVFMIAGALAAFAGMLLSSRINSGSPIAGQGYELDAIAAAVIGGTSITGGVGKIYGTIVGSLLLAVISNGLDLIGVSSYYQSIISGVIIVAVVFMDIRSKSKG